MLIAFFLVAAFLAGCPNVEGQTDSVQPQQPATALPAEEQRMKLARAVMAEKVENLVPVRSAIAFPVGIGQVYCYTSFDPVPQPAIIYHRWYHRENLSTQTRLRVYPPRWSTYSVIQLRETDKGPWRVEITDNNGRVLDTLRFSITD
ncbi:MAG: DUF2914 domain-containing protein [Syntrophobacteraceae bacterium]|jgi:hypothetical protein|nr:DUF2914 domain-containing protein [Syntrophobacteraceae bacterium]